MSLLRQSTQAFRAAASASSSARWMSTSVVLRNTAQANTSPAPAKGTENQTRDVTAEQVQRHDQAVTADLVSSAPRTYDSHTQPRSWAPVEGASKRPSVATVSLCRLDD